MIQFHRVGAIVLRYFYSIWRNMGQLFDLVYWPLMDILMFGFVSIWMSNRSSNSDPYVTVKMLTALVFWQVLFRANLEIALAVLEEIWSRNMVSLFSSPLYIVEWIMGVMILGALKTIFTVCYGAAIVWLIYGVNIFALGPIFLFYLLIAIITGWALGFLGAALIIRWGDKVQTVAWAMGWLFAPFAAVFYPLEVLPVPLQMVARCFPMTYLFENMRELVGSGECHYPSLFLAFGLSIVYVMSILFLFRRMFEKSRNRGLERLYS